MSAASVSRETPIYERLLTWAVWATDRRHVPVRHDAISAGSGICDELVAQVAEIRQQHFPPAVEVVEKAVAELRIEEPELYCFLEEYFLRWKDITDIAWDSQESEHHVIEYLQRALRYLARSLPRHERRINGGGG